MKNFPFVPGATSLEKSIREMRRQPAPHHVTLSPNPSATRRRFNSSVRIGRLQFYNKKAQANFLHKAFYQLQCHRFFFFIVCPVCMIIQPCICKRPLFTKLKTTTRTLGFLRLCQFSERLHRLMFFFYNL